MTRKLKTGLRLLIVDMKRVRFSLLTEREFESYLRRRSKIMFGLTTMEVRKLAYECAVKFNIKVPDVAKINYCPGPDSWPGFPERNIDLSIRKREATSFKRSASFNKENVKHFNDNCQVCSLGAIIHQVMFITLMRREHLLSWNHIKQWPERVCKNKAKTFSVRKSDLFLLNSTIQELPLFRASQHCSCKTDPESVLFSAKSSSTLLLVRYNTSPYTHCWVALHAVTIRSVFPIDENRSLRPRVSTCSGTSGRPPRAFTHCQASSFQIGEDWTSHRYFDRCSVLSEITHVPLLSLVHCLPNRPFPLLITAGHLHSTYIHALFPSAIHFSLEDGGSKVHRNDGILP